MNEELNAIFKLIEPALKKGVQVKVCYNQYKERLEVDLNTGMKSDLILTADGEGVISCHGRYDHKAVVEDYRGLLLEVENCDHGRNFGSCIWQDILRENG